MFTPPAHIPRTSHPAKSTAPRFEGFHRLQRYPTELARQEQEEWVRSNNTSVRDQAYFKEAGPPGSGRQITYMLFPGNEAWVFTGLDANRIDFELGLNAQGIRGTIAPDWTLPDGSRLNFDFRSNYPPEFSQYIKTRLQQVVFPHRPEWFVKPFEDLIAAEVLKPGLPAGESLATIPAHTNLGDRLLKVKTPAQLLTAIEQLIPYLMEGETQKILDRKSRSLGDLFVKAMRGNSRSATQLVSRILLSQEAPAIASYLANRLEETMDQLAAKDEAGLSFPSPKGIRIGHHPMLAELFLILNAPSIAKDTKALNALTAAITSIDRFVNYEIKVTGQTVNNWARIGLLTHGFRFWKYDAQGGMESLLAQFGFNPIPARASDATFGPGYLYRMDDTLIEFRRGYLLVSHPDRGTLLIRNSSHVFGRNLMAEPAYYTPKALTVNEIKSLAPTPDIRKQLGFQRILAPELNRRRGFQHDLDSLLNDLMIMKKSFAHWKFDPKAFDSRKGFQGDLTPGLKGVLDLVQQRLGERELGMSDKPVPSLGLFKPNLPPDFSFATYEFTPQNIRELEARLDGSWREEDFPNSQWTPFVQTAVDKNAEMVLVDPVQET